MKSNIESLENKSENDQSTIQNLKKENRNHKSLIEEQGKRILATDNKLKKEVEKGIPYSLISISVPKIRRKNFGKPIAIFKRSSKNMLML